MVAKTYLIHNELFDETFTAHIEKNGASWVGLVPDIPELKCHGDTVEAVEQKLPSAVNQELIREEEAWERVLTEAATSETMKKLEAQAQQNYNEGRYTKLVVLS